jgi:hypothetical protein
MSTAWLAVEAVVAIVHLQNCLPLLLLLRVSAADCGHAERHDQVWCHGGVPHRPHQPQAW